MALWPGGQALSGGCIPVQKALSGAEAHLHGREVGEGDTLDVVNHDTNTRLTTGKRVVVAVEVANYHDGDEH